MSFALTGHFIFHPPLDGDPVAQMDVVLDVQCVYEAMTFAFLKFLAVLRSRVPTAIHVGPKQSLLRLDEFHVQEADGDSGENNVEQRPTGLVESLSRCDVAAQGYAVRAV